jgi:hypothetical protein
MGCVSKMSTLVCERGGGGILSELTYAGEFNGLGVWEGKSANDTGCWLPAFKN